MEDDVMMTFEIQNPTAVDDDHVLTVRNLTKSYGNLMAVGDLSLDVLRGEVFALLGPNGAGKTTTISIICGLQKGDSGRVMIDGHSMEEDPRECRRLIGLCPQDIVIWESLRCLEQLEFMGRMYDLEASFARKRALELLGILGLEGKKHALAKTLSGGMKRRLNIAMALIHDPPILILDEPQAGLDPQSRILVREYIRSLAEKGTTVVLTTHEMDEADRLADRVAIIDHGRLLVLDTPRNLKDHVGEGDILEITIADAQTEQVSRLQENLPKGVDRMVYQQGVLRFVGVDVHDALPTLMERLRQGGLEIEDMVFRKKTLEDVFVSLTGRRLRD